ncbi:MULTISPECIES: Fic family protein [unclassified Adlercreutzia]|uniref:Fic family protein n=1 Tax=unclassified Adlercreutzia TaxID=2636013 RepID=UPI0021060D72|nr:MULTISPECIES: ATP-binding protein [unclassified Adlercreutzia]
MYSDAVEILSPGWFIKGQDPDKHLSGESKSSITRNPLISKTLYRSGDIEAYGTDIKRIKDLCDDAGIEVEYVRTVDGTNLVFHRNDPFGQNVVVGASPANETEHETDPADRPSTDPVPTQLTDPVARLCAVLADGPLGISEAMGSLGLSQKRNFRERYLNPALELNCIERTIPDKPNSSKQKYRLTDKGRQYLQEEIRKIGV